MGQYASIGDSTRLTIIHKFGSTPPTGWSVGGTSSFHVKSGEHLYEILEKINEYRSPSQKLTTLYTDTGEVVSLSSQIPHTGMTLYV